jgi:hypothetical protein
MWKALSVAVLAASIAAMAPATQAVTSSGHHRCVERGLKAGTPRYNQCVRQQLSLQHLRSKATHATPPLPAAPADDSARADPDRLSTAQLQQAVAGPPPVQDITVQARPTTQGLAPFAALQQALIQKKADAKRQDQVNQSSELIRAGVVPRPGP